MPRERSCLLHSGAQQSHLPDEFFSNRRHRHRGMAASNPLPRDASASREPSSHSMYCITATNAALPSHTFEGLVGPYRPWSSRRSCGAPPRPRYRLRSSALEPQCAAKIVARGRSARVRLCPWIFQAPTMSSAIGTENKIASRVARRETRADRCTP